VRAVGIDLGAHVVWAVAAVVSEDGAGRIVDGAAFGVDELEALTSWCGDATVAIDAPAGPSEGHHLDDVTVSAKFRPARCAEVALGRAGYWVSWVTAAGPQAPWVEAGFAVYGALAHLSPLEVFPHAVFSELLGGRPPPKQTLAGRRARLSVLDLPVGAELWGHDGIDAAAACLVAIDHTLGKARAVGCADHEGGSIMWLPA
jgi:hypothetical protein